MRSPESSFVSPVLIGRATILLRLEQFIDSARQSRGQVALVTGEAGIGKSRMVAEAKTRFAAAGAGLIVQGRCFEPDHALPYAPLLDLLRQNLGSRASDEMLRALGPTAPEIVKLLPELSARLPGIAPSATLEPEAEKRRLFDALAQWFARLCGDGGTQPLLVIIEDLHWSDETSLEFLAYFAHRVDALPLLLVLTYRNDEMQPSLRHFVAGLDRARLGSELSLERLSEADVDALIQAIMALGRPVYKEFLEPVYTLTEGNPFFVEEVLKSLTAAGDIFLSDGRWERKPMSELRIPRSVQDAVQRRADRLSEAAREVLTLAAVAGRRFDFALLLQLTGLDERDLLARIKELMSAQLVVEESADQFAFRHALTRQAVYAKLLARERRVLHHQIAEAMQAIYVDALDAHVSDLAYHCYEGAAWEQALSWSQRAGEKAQALYTPAAAIEQFSRALEASHKLNAESPLALYRSRGQAYEMVGQFDAARADFEQVLQSARSQRDARAEWQALIDLGSLWAARDYARTGDYFQQALAVARPLGDPAMLGHSLNRVGNWHANVERPVEGLHYHREALDIFEELNDRRGLVQTLDLLGTASFIGSDLVQGLAYHRRAAQLFRELDDRPGLVSSLVFVAVSRPYCGAETLVASTLGLAEATHAAESAVQIAREINFRSGEVSALNILVGCLAAQGDYKGALDAARRGLETAELIEHRQWMAQAHLGLGALLLDLLALPASLRHFERARVMAEEIGSEYWRDLTAAMLVWLYVQAHELTLALAVVDAIPERKGSFQTLSQRQCWYARAELALARGDPLTALDIVERLVASAFNLTAGTVIPGLWKLHGEALAMLGRHDDAEATLRAALATASQMEKRWHVWRIHVALGNVYRVQARATEAEAQYSTARERIAELAVNIPDAELDLVPGISLRANFIEKANAMLPAARPLSPRRAAKQEFGGLTSREREVAVLIARGRSNQQMAAELVLSERTIEGHVGNILSKLGFASRAQIAAWAVENGLAGSNRK